MPGYDVSFRQADLPASLAQRVHVKVFVERLSFCSPCKSRHRFVFAWVHVDLLSIAIAKQSQNCSSLEQLSPGSLYMSLGGAHGASRLWLA